MAQMGKPILTRIVTPATERGGSKERETMAKWRIRTVCGDQFIVTAKEWFQDLLANPQGILEGKLTWMESEYNSHLDRYFSVRKIGKSTYLIRVAQVVWAAPFKEK